MTGQEERGWSPSRTGCPRIHWPSLLLDDDTGPLVKRPRLKPTDAVTNVRSFRERIAFLAEDARVTDRLQGLLADVECSGKHVHDANVIATTLAHDVGTVVTMNLADFARFERYVSLVEL
jgi:hypothetical protein